MAQIAFFKSKMGEYQQRCTELQELLQLRENVIQEQLRDRTDFWTAENARLMSENRALRQ